MKRGVMIRWMEDGRWHYMITDDPEYLEKFSKVIPCWEYVIGTDENKNKRRRDATK